jgi:tRNA G10  N-methylase Trm11
MRLEWGDYKHFPYERELALREAAAVLGGGINVSANGDVSSPLVDLDAARALTYFSVARAGDESARTLQSQLERSAAQSSKRQSTRYSVHGLHEYRGKFNPQVCNALINILGVTEGHMLLDPFCGSGTTIVEASHRGIEAVGTDLNPLAVFIANAKLKALETQPSQLETALSSILAMAGAQKVDTFETQRRTYLEAWFEAEPLQQIEQLRMAVEKLPSALQPFFLVVASNILRDFSLQEPADLRIRRRLSANVVQPFLQIFEKAAREGIRKLKAAIEVIPVHRIRSVAELTDNRFLHDHYGGPTFDAAITSPPYATALPYIDTQRLSLVWLSLLAPSEIGKTEGDLIGSREMGPQEKRRTLLALRENTASLPEPEANFCGALQDALNSNDGFRRQAVPILLYRYFELMGQTFQSVRKCFKSGGRFALIVGHNHTQLGGKRFDIDTPKHLASLAEHQGWSVEEITALQPYQRYGLHAANAVKSEALIILKA